MTTHTDIVLRSLVPTDGPALADLFEQTPDTGQITFTERFKVDAYTALIALHPNTAGVVAVLGATGQIVGIAMVDISHRQVEDQVRPCALLNTLKVHPNYRRQGIAGRLAQWRIDYARQRQGEEVVILANIQKNNIGSQQAARRWCNQFVGEPATVLVQMRNTPPPLRVDITLRPARLDELDTVAAQQNHFYRNYNLYVPQTDESLAAWRTHTPFETPLREIYVAVDATDAILAGAGVTEQARILSLHVGRLPPAMQLVNQAIRLLPPNGVVDEVIVDQLWFKDGQVAAGQYLWEWLRWETRNRGSVLRTAYDPRGPLPAVLRLPFWLPKAQSTFAVRSPVPLTLERLIVPFG